MKLGLLVAEKNVDRQTDRQHSCFISIDRLWLPDIIIQEKHKQKNTLNSTPLDTISTGCPSSWLSSLHIIGPTCDGGYSTRLYGMESEYHVCFVWSSMQCCDISYFLQVLYLISSFLFLDFVLVNSIKTNMLCCKGIHTGKNILTQKVMKRGKDSATNTLWV